MAKKIFGGNIVDLTDPLDTLDSQVLALLQARLPAGGSATEATLAAIRTALSAGLKQGAAGAEAWPVHDDWAPALVADVTDDDSDKTFTVPASTQYQPLSILVDLTTSGDAGDRQLSVLFTTGADVVIAEARAGAVQAASVARRYVFAIGSADLLAFRDTDLLTVPLPVLVLPAGYKIRIYDNNAVAAAADDMHVQMMVMSRAA